MKMKLKLSDKWYQIRTKAEAGCLDIAAGMSLESVSKKQKIRKQDKKVSTCSTASKVKTISRTRAS